VTARDAHIITHGDIFVTARDAHIITPSGDIFVTARDAHIITPSGDIFVTVRDTFCCYFAFHSSRSLCFCLTYFLFEQFLYPYFFYMFTLEAAKLISLCKCLGQLLCGIMKGRAHE
jgi:hypothetical protein